MTNIFKKQKSQTSYKYYKQTISQYLDHKEIKFDNKTSIKLLHFFFVTGFFKLLHQQWKFHIKPNSNK